MALSEASATGIPQWDAGQGKRLHYNHLMPTPQDLSAATWLAKLAAPGTSDIQRTTRQNRQLVS